MRGRKPVPVEERIKRGEHPRRPPLVVGGRDAPRMPPNMNAYQQTAFRQIVSVLAPSNMLDLADSCMVEGMARSHGTDRQAQAAIVAMARRHKNVDPEVAAGGLLIRNSQGWTANPLVGISERERRETRLFAAELGLSPTSRARLGLVLVRNTGEGADAEMEREIGLAPRLLHAVGQVDG